MKATDRLKQLKSNYQYGFHVPEDYVFKSRRGLDEKIVEEISFIKNEPPWMRDYRLRAYQIFKSKILPSWGGNLTEIDFNNIFYYLKPIGSEAKTWEELPAGIRETYNKLGIPEAEKKYLAGVKGQFESEVIYGSLLKSLQEKGVVFLGMDEGLKKYPDLVKEYFGTVIPSADNKFAALNSSVWSGGSFVYVPKGVKIDLPLQAYFRINAPNMGQFERTLIIADEGSFVSYVEGCFTKDTPVKTNPSIKTIQDVKVGDKVLTHTGKYQEVYHTQIRKYSGDLYSINYYGDSNAKIEVTEEHPVLCVRREVANERNKVWVASWVPVRKLREEDYLVQVSDRGFTYVPIQSLSKRKVWNLEVYNFSVEDDESYVAGGVAVHNCSAPVYSTDSLHSAVVEIIVHRGARVRYTTIQNWSTNVYNLVTKRAKVLGDGIMEWVDYNGGSRLTMKFPSVFLMEPGARGEVLSLAFAGAGQHQDAGGKAIHAAPHTSSQIISKSVSLNGGRTSYRGLLQIYPGAHHSKSKVVCDALILDPESRSDTYPTMKIDESQVTVEHEATVSKVGQEQLFYLMSRGLTETQASSLIVSGFVEPIVKQLPLEYAVELNRLIELQMEGSVG